MDLSALRLTAKDLHWSQYSAAEQWVAEAQLRKAVWGIRKLLEEYYPDASIGEDWCQMNLSDYLEGMILAAGIPKEEDE